MSSEGARMRALSPNAVVLLSGDASLTVFTLAADYSEPVVASISIPPGTPGSLCSGVASRKRDVCS